MITADFIVQRDIDAAHSLATDRHLMQVVHRRSRLRHAVLRVYNIPGDVLSIGRYHLAPSRVGEPGPVSLCRRMTGGRPMPFGDGFIGLSLVLPHRSAFYSDDPLTLAPYQVMNRYVRGILDAFRLVNIPAFYPGRDFVTVEQRVLAMVSFETDASGALLFEALIANTRDFGMLPQLLEAVDPDGLIKIELLATDRTTSLARELKRELSFAEVADMLQQGFTKQFGLICDERSLTALEEQAVGAIAAREFEPPQWLQLRHLRPDLDRHSSLWVQLGMFEAYFGLEQEHFIKDIVFAGDFLANSASVTQLEKRLRLCPAEWRAIHAMANEVYSAPENYILGIGQLRTVADMIARGLGA